MKKRVSHFARTILIILVLISIKSSLAQYVSHLGGGGEWTDGNTWIGGFAPGPGDNVVINGAVQVDISTSCNNITINNTGTLMNKNNSNKTLTVNGNITNYGTIQDNYYSLYLDIHGNVHQEATWQNQKTNLVNTSSQDVWCTSPFTGANFSNTQAGNTITITSNILSFIACKLNSESSLGSL